MKGKKLLEQCQMVDCVYSLSIVFLFLSVLYISEMKQSDVGLMWQWGVVSGSVWIERQLWWLARRCKL